MKIEEGKEFSFTIEKLITLPDGQYFIILAEYEQKYLLPAQYYLEYGFQIGQKIICRIDRINCNGKVFFEPRHPIYSIGDKDVFLLKEKEERIKHKTKEKYLVIKAESANTKRAIIDIELQNDIYSQGKKYNCAVIKIKKGEVILKVISIV